MTAHISQSDIERLARNDLGTADWGRVRRHFFECDSCLRRLIDFEAPRPATVSTDSKPGGTTAQPRAAVCRAYVY